MDESFDRCSDGKGKRFGRCGGVGSAKVDWDDTRMGNT